MTIKGTAVEFAHRVGPAADNGGSDGMVTIEVVNPGLDLPHMITREPRKGTFELRVPEGTTLHYPWVGYRATLELPHKINTSDRAVRFLNMLMNLTRAHGQGASAGPSSTNCEDVTPSKAPTSRPLSKFCKPAASPA
ncbi:hypothetical protein K8Z49_01150 [Actinomadura madurae]|uniref:hypothetical protein n=1 Tax=Actinomadura madurae TaxID=1993 RepID=UPI00399C3BB7